MIPCIHGIVSDTLFTQHVSLYPHHKHQETGQDISLTMCSRPFHFTPSAKVETHRQCNLWTHWCARELCWLDVAGGFRWAEDIRSRCSQLLDVRARHSRLFDASALAKRKQLLSIWCSLVRWPRRGSHALSGRDWFFTGDYYYRNGRRTPGQRVSRCTLFMCTAQFNCFAWPLDYFRTTRPMEGLQCKGVAVWSGSPQHASGWELGVV